MFYARKNQKHFDIWPAYVDILATVLMVLIFVLMTFVLAQLYLSDSIVNKDSVINSLNSKVQSLDTNLDGEKKRLQKAQAELLKLENILTIEINGKNELTKNNTELQFKLKQMFEDLKQVTNLLDVEEKINKGDSITIQDLSEGIKILQKELKDLKEQNKFLVQESEQHKELTKVHYYRSEFFTKLKRAIGNIDDVKVVGDRFVFQSELLFAPGSADLGEEGKLKLIELSKTLKEISKKIPENINWILRVDGHTDNSPIRHKFASNWELSVARSLAVLKFLNAQGIESKRLVAAGFGEYQTVNNGQTEPERAKNRRIEFKLDQR